MQRLSHLALNDEGFVFDPTTGASFQVSQTGLAILRALRDGKADEEIAQTLTDRFEVGLEDAKRDVADFRGQLKTVGLA